MSIKDKLAVQKRIEKDTARRIAMWKSKQN